VSGDTRVLSLLDVGKTFLSGSGAPVDVLRNVSLDFHQGEFVVVTGPSGSGKTTLLHLCALLDLPTRGRVLFCGDEVKNLSARRQARLRAEAVGIVYQQFHLLPHRTALENVQFRFRYVPHEFEASRSAAREALDTVGLADAADRPARVLSGGEMQRVAIARAIVLPPRFLVADEPTGNLDGDSAREIIDTFRKLHRRGHTILMASHNPSIARQASRTLHLREGRLNS
jgi:putative ABC transport system ATP-binding protein